MPIKNLTGQASFPQIGTLRKGEEKQEGSNRPGKDLEYFRFDTQDEDAMRAFREYYKEEPKAIRVFLPFQSIDENFDAWQEEWAASSLKHRCDGETCVLWLDGAKYSRQPKPCPGGCKQAGRLKVVIPELGRMAYVTVLTTSKHDIISIDSSLRALYNGRGSLVGIPLILRRVEREISTPRGDKRARVTKSLITIEAQQEWASLHIRALQESSMPMLDAGDAPQPLRLVPAPDEAMNGEALIDGVTASAITDLWPHFGGTRRGELIPLEAYVKEKGFNDLYSMTQEVAKTILKWLEQRQMAAVARPAEPEVIQDEAVEPAKADDLHVSGLDQWECTQESGTRNLAMQVLSVWDEAKAKLNLTDDDLRKEMTEVFTGEGLTSRKQLTAEQANQLIGYLREFITAAMKTKTA